jgi:hypothetical protein
MKKIDYLLVHANESAACEQKLKSVFGVENYDVMTIKHFYSVKEDLFKSFVRLKITEDLCKLNEKVTPTLKDEINDVDKVIHPVLLEVACKLRNNVS